MSFNKNFVWGAAAASYQIEGAWDEDGKGLSVWDMFSSQENKIWRNHNGRIACDHYHRYREDVENMSAIGLKAYRLSVSWPRVLPAGTGNVNAKGLDFYDRLMDALLEKNITPWITLFHWDYPYTLFQKGGWLNPDSSDWFAEYTRIIVDRLSDRCCRWITFNEPQCFVGFGHQTGRHAPGLQLGMHDVLLAAHNVLLAHGKAVRTIRDHAGTTPSIGASQANFVSIPIEEDKITIDRARSHMFSIREKNMLNITWFPDPMILGRYPEDGLKLFENDMPDMGADDMKIISQKLDFFGTNIYFGAYLDAQGNEIHQVGGPMTTMGWDVMPRTLYWGPRFLYERYKLPVVITENGFANCDWVQLDGKVHDPQRIDYLHRHLRELKRAVKDGVAVDGYFAWSIMDNFEWADGYKQRLGLIYVDYETQKRILKDSAFWYTGVIKDNGNNL